MLQTQRRVTEHVDFVNEVATSHIPGTHDETQTSQLSNAAALLIGQEENGNPLETLQEPP